MAKSAKQKAGVGTKNRANPGNRGFKVGQGAVRAGSALKKSNASSKTGRTGPKGEKNVKEKGSSMRSENTIRRLQMYKSTPNLSKMKEQSTKPCRIQPDRRWFGNTRVIAQDKMQAFRETLAKGVQDPFSVVLRSSKLPMSLLKETEDKASKMNLLSAEPFNEVFSKGRRQKRVKLANYDLEGLMQSVSQKTQGYNGDRDTKAGVDGMTGLEKEAKPDVMGHFGEEIFKKGTSPRIWAELYKVVDSSDVLIFVLDARDPLGTRCKELEREIRKKHPGKHIVLLLNKVDLIPTWAARRWVQILTKERPTLAFHASITNPFGKNSLLNLLRQFGVLIKERKHLTIGMIGYPNVGKSSVINTMKSKKVCKAAPVPGETKVWQYIALTKKLYLLDCPGIVPPTESDFGADCAKVLKGVVRAERIQNPSDYIDEVLSRVKRQYLLQRFKLPPDTTWRDGEDFLIILGRKMGKLHKGGEVDIEITARIVLYDWQRGRIPFFSPPPEDADSPTATQPAASSSSTSPGNAGAEQTTEDSESRAKAIADSSPPTTDVKEVKVQQSFTELACCMSYDAEDRRGDPLPEERGVQETKAEASATKPKAGRRRKRPAAEKGKSGEEAGEEASQKKKRKRSVGKKKKATSNGESREGGMAVPRGSMDWKAVVAEFGM
jgi:nuclear GTP-binding protein